MSTERQITANRLNAQKSSGPATRDGKAITAQNALKTGLDAKSEILRNENRGEHDELAAEYYSRFAPTVPDERFLVDRLISSEWLHRRYLSVEADIWERSFRATDSPSLGGVFLRSSETFTRVQRKIDAAQRNHANALKLLLAMRANNTAAPAPSPVLGPIAVPEPPPSSNHPAVELSPPLPSRDSNGEVAKHSESFETPANDAATEQLNTELAQFLTSAPPAPALPGSAPPTPSQPAEHIGAARIFDIETDRPPTAPPNQ